MVPHLACRRGSALSEEDYLRLSELALVEIGAHGFHWFSYQFVTVPHHPFAGRVFGACASIDCRAPGIGTQLLKELCSIGGKDRHEPHYEMLLQKLAEILVIERIVAFDWPSGTTFQHEPTAVPHGPRPELLVTYEGRRLVVEVKTPSLLNHMRQRQEKSTQLAYRSVFGKQLTERSGGDVTLPRDNPILDFLKDSERKFREFRTDPNTASLLVIMWDDFIYEPISVLINPFTGLLTPQTFAKDGEGNPLAFPNVDAVIALRHLHNIVADTRDQVSHMNRTAMDLGHGELPHVLFPRDDARQLPDGLAEHLRAFPYDDPSLTMFAEYNVQDSVHWIDMSSAK
jgi:hypothetical protein